MGVTNLMYKGVHYDSDEEIFIAMWLEELKNEGIVKEYHRCLEPIGLTQGLKVEYEETKQLKTKTKVVQKTKIFLRPSEYTYDFKVMFNADDKRSSKICSGITCDFNPNSVLYRSFSERLMISLIEVKPNFDQNSMTRLFVNNQKFIYEKYKFFVNLIEPMTLFEKTFLPLEAAPYFRYKVLSAKAKATGKKIGDYKFDWTPKTIKQFLNDKV
jgi:hypothetical protein